MSGRVEEEATAQGMFRWRRNRKKFKTPGMGTIGVAARISSKQEVRA